MAGSLYTFSRTAELKPSNVRLDAKASPLVIMTMNDRSQRFAPGRLLPARISMWSSWAAGMWRPTLASSFSGDC